MKRWYILETGFKISPMAKEFNSLETETTIKEIFQMDKKQDKDILDGEMVAVTRDNFSKAKCMVKVIIYLPSNKFMKDSLNRIKSMDMECNKHLELENILVIVSLSRIFL